MVFLVVLVNCYAMSRVLMIESGPQHYCEEDNLLGRSSALGLL